MSDTVFDAVGGQAFFDDLVARFYERVAADPVLRPLYPVDMQPSAHHLALFLGQYWGGPTTYSDSRGHPMLRRRHFAFAIGEAERDAWYAHMEASVRDAALDDETGERLLEYFAMAATHLVNS